MKEKKVICVENLPSRAPLFQTAVLYLFIDHFSSVGWVQGVCWTLIVLGWMAFFYSVAREKAVDIFEK